MELFMALAALVFLMLSLRRFMSGKKRALLFLLLSGFAVRVFFALLDVLPNTWDESFHAVVAKNFMKHWFLPTLYDDPLIKLPTYWVECHVWLHKPPLFLWQMAAGMKVFGTNAFAMRLPGVLMSTIQLFFIYDIGKRAIGVNTGYFAALVSAFAYYPLALLSGVACNDQNDLAFVFYVCASFWAWYRYKETETIKWAVITGLFAGMAVLVKWLPGLIVFLGWGLTIVFTKENRGKIRNYWHFMLAILVCCLVFLPWQIYIFKAFPLLARDELDYSARHFTEVLELHGGPWYFYIQTLKNVYPLWMETGTVIIFLSLVLLFVDLKKRNDRLFFYSCLLFVYLFFSLAATKMISFTFIVSPIIYLGVGNALARIIFVFKGTRFKAMGVVTLIFFVLGFFNLKQVYQDHFANDRRNIGRAYRDHILDLGSRFSGKEVVMFNVQFLDALQIMFFTDDVKVYTIIPRPEHIEEMIALGKKPVIIYHKDLPDHILNDRRITILERDKFLEH